MGVVVPWPFALLHLVAVRPLLPNARFHLWILLTFLLLELISLVCAFEFLSSAHRGLGRIGMVVGCFWIGRVVESSLPSFHFHARPNRPLDTIAIMSINVRFLRYIQFHGHCRFAIRFVQVASRIILVEVVLTWHLVVVRPLGSTTSSIFLHL